MKRATAVVALVAACSGRPMPQAAPLNSKIVDRVLVWNAVPPQYQYLVNPVQRPPVSVAVSGPFVCILGDADYVRAGQLVACNWGTAR